jgi:class 3 adenylate cyclase/tetratricopeptide (TPR) repeat protein
MEWAMGTVLFADVSGFTPMSEALSVLGAEGAEILTDILNRYFADMIGVIHSHGGQVMKFGGDAILCFFPDKPQAADGRRQEEDGNATAPFMGAPAQAEACGSISTSLRCALVAARKMQEGMTRFQNIRTPVKKFALKMKIGIAHGEVLLAGVGDPNVRCDYVFAGEPVDATSDAEHHAVAGEIIFAGDGPKVQSSKFKVEEIESGFHRILDVSSPPVSHLPSPVSPTRTSSSELRASASYLIREVYDLVASGHAAQVGALLEIVPVFLKFTGFTYTREGFDLPLFDAFFRTVMEVTQRHGGRLNRISMGDKGSTALLLFGAPNPLEKKEALACQWALELGAAVRARFPRLTVGAGLNSGRVFTGIVGGSGRWEYTVMGDAVNFAARLMQGAEAGQACVGEVFAKRAREVYGFDDLGERKFKGKTEPLAVFALKERRRAGWTAEGIERPVGREKEREALLGHLDAAFKGAPGMAVVEGEPGVGKSFLSSHILREAHRRGWRTVPAKGEITRRSHAYAPWVDLFEDLLFRGSPPETGILDQCLEKEDQPYHSWFREFFGLPFETNGEIPAYDEETRKRLFQHRLALLLLRQAQEKPLFLFLDDLHWFDTLSLDFLASLLNHYKNQRTFILSATRPVWAKKDFEHRATVHFISLADLDRDGCRTLAEGRLGGKVRDALTDFLYDRARGNPFFTHQLLDYLLHEDLMETRLGEWLLKRGVEQKGALSGIEILLAQINRLPVVEQAHMRTAACIGPTFSATVLEKVRGSAFRKKAMKGLLERGYIQPLEGDTWSFPHTLVQETVYQAMPQKIRRRIHRRIGQCLEAFHAGRMEPYYPNLANHFLLGGVKDKAVRYGEAAGNYLFRTLSFPESSHYFARALEVVGRARHPRKYDIALALSRAMLKSGRLSECLAVARRLRHMPLDPEDARKYWAYIYQIDAMEKLGRYDYVDEANAILRSLPAPHASLANPIRHLIGIAYYRKGEFDKALDMFNVITRDDRSSIDMDMVASSWIHIAAIENKRARQEGATAIIHRGLEIVHRQNSPYHELRLQQAYAVILMENRKYDEAKHLYERMLPHIEHYGDVYLLAAVHLNLGLIETWLAHWPEASGQLSEASKIFSALGVLNGYAKSQMNLGILAFYRTEFQKAYDYYYEGTKALEKAGEMTEVCHGCFNLSEACVKLNRKREAYQWHKKGIESFHQEDSPKLYQMFQDLEEQIKQLQTAE